MFSLEGLTNTIHNTLSASLSRYEYALGGDADCRYLC